MSRTRRGNGPPAEDFEIEEDVSEQQQTPHVTDRPRRSDEGTPRRVAISAPEGEELTLEGLRRQLSMAFTQIEALTREAGPASGRRASERYSTSSSTYGEEGGRSRAKLERPPIFSGEYHELNCVLNWINDVQRYFTGTNCPEADRAIYARSYMGATVKAWMDALFPSNSPTPTFEELSEQLKLRYLPPDHKIRVELKFEEVTQAGDSLQRYTERFQVLDTALITAGVKIENDRKILRYISGLNREEDRRFLLEKGATTLVDLYRHVITLRQAKTLASRGAHSKKTQPDRDGKKLNALSYEERQRAREKGLCLGCGKAGHYINACPAVKKTIKALAGPRPKSSSTTATSGSRDKRRKLRKMLKKLCMEDEESAPSQHEDEGDDDDDDDDKKSDSSEEDGSSSGNSEEETQG